MMQYWKKIETKIDALTLRDRTAIFIMAAVVLIMLVNTFLLEPQFTKQVHLSNKIKQEQSIIDGMRTEIQQKLAAHESDPDVANRSRLETLKQQSQQLQGALQDVQKGLVSPDKMSALLEDIVKQNSRLHLISLKTLPLSSLTDMLGSENKGADEKPIDVSLAPKAAPNVNLVAASIYKHGVEIKVQGEYLDILNYLAQLEAMKWQLFWGKAELTVDEYPKSTLTLNLFTLSLDKKWLSL